MPILKDIMGILVCIDLMAIAIASIILTIVMWKNK